MRSGIIEETIVDDSNKPIRILKIGNDVDLWQGEDLVSISIESLNKVIEILSKYKV